MRKCRVSASFFDGKHRRSSKVTAGLPAGASEMHLGQQQPKSPLGVKRGRYAQQCNRPLTPPMQTSGSLLLCASSRRSVVKGTGRVDVPRSLISCSAGSGPVARVELTSGQDQASPARGPHPPHPSASPSSAQLRHQCSRGRRTAGPQRAAGSDLASAREPSRT